MFKDLVMSIVIGCIIIVSALSIVGIMFAGSKLGPIIGFISGIIGCFFGLNIACTGIDGAMKLFKKWKI